MRLLVCAALALSGCSLVLPEELSLITYSGTIALNADVDVIASNGCSSADFDLIANGKYSITVKTPMCVKTRIAGVSSVRWTPAGIFSEQSSELANGVYKITARAQAEGTTKLSMTALSELKGQTHELSAEMRVEAVRRVKFAQLCAAKTGLLPTDTDVSFEWRMYGTRELGGYGYHPIDAPGLTIKEVTVGKMVLHTDAQPRTLTVTSPVDATLSLGLRLVAPSEFDTLQVLDGGQQTLQEGQSLRLSAMPKLGGVAPCIDDPGHYPVTFSILTPQKCGLAGDGVRGLAPGTCQVRAQLDGTALATTLQIDVSPRTTWLVTFAPDAGETLRGIWAGGDAGDVFVVGAQANGPAVFRRSGGSWARMTTPERDGGRLTAVWGSGPGDVWAAGNVVLHFDGAGWSEVDVGAGVEIAEVWGSGPNDVYFAGRVQGAALGWLGRWNGSTFSTVPEAAELDVKGVSGNGPANVWAVGTVWVADGGLPGRMLRFDGGSWAQPLVFPRQNAMDAVWVDRTGRVFVALIGPGGGVAHVDTRPGLFIDDYGFQASTVWGSGLGDIYAAAADGGGYRHYDGVWRHGFVFGPVQDIWGTSPSNAYMVLPGAVLKK